MPAETCCCFALSLTALPAEMGCSFTVQRLTSKEIGNGKQQAGAEHSGFLPEHGPQGEN
jgi:hypothetical protein